MKKRRIGLIGKLLILIVFLGILTCFIDYNRVLSNEEPLFAIKTFDKNKKIQKYRGFFYIVERKISVSETETMKESKNITFKVLIFELSLKARQVEEKKNLKVSYKSDDECTTSKLVYATEEIKVYTYCLDDIKFNIDNKDLSYKDFFKSNDLTEVLPFYGMDNDKTTEIYIDNEKEYSKDGFRLYKCNNSNDKKSLYFTDIKTDKQLDFCTLKDDDFSFTFKIEDNNEPDVCQVEEGKDPLPVEVFYEDEENTYTFECNKSNNIKLINYNKELSIKDALKTNQVTITDLKNKGLKFNTVKKEIPKEE